MLSHEDWACEHLLKRMLELLSNMKAVLRELEFPLSGDGPEERILQLASVGLEAQINELSDDLRLALAPGPEGPPKWERPFPLARGETPPNPPEGAVSPDGDT